MISAFDITAERLDHRHLTQNLVKLPKRFRPTIERRYVDLYQTQGRRAANLSLLDIADSLGGNRALLGADDSELCAYAKKKADECFRVAAWWKDADAALQAMEQVAQKSGIQPPSDQKITPTGRRARLICELWWRRQIRRSIARQVELAAIGLGMVSKRAGIYASDETVMRRAGQRRRNRALLETIIAENDEGQQYTLQQLSDLGVSNPEIRRMELMMRIDGFDQIAVALDHASEFWTITTPSKFHAVKSSGKANTKYNKSTPREAQAHLSQGWAMARAYLAKQGLKLYGFRVVEPHHDGTPHWHMCMFLPKAWPGETQRAAVPRVRAIMRRYALREDGKEFGARKARFVAVAIDRSRGSAAGYLAKYISKNINGKGAEHEDDYEGGGNLSDNAVRVDAWASCWGIRQFQQIGGAPVGVWRELRRLGEVADDAAGAIADLTHAADKGNWRRYTELMGGPTVARVDMAARVRRVNFDIRSRYDGDGVVRVDGVEVARGAVFGEGAPYSSIGDFEKTRLRVWMLKRAFTPAWSSVNNCNRGEDGKSKNRRDDAENRGAMARSGRDKSAWRQAESGSAMGKNGEGGRTGRSGGEFQQKAHRSHIRAG